MARAALIKEREPAANTAVIDLGHLARMTFGDRDLEREILQLFERQVSVLLGRMHENDVAGVRALAHTLKGSAASIGAAGMVQAAAAVEEAAGTSESGQAVSRLAVAIDEARRAIAVLLSGSKG